MAVISDIAGTSNESFTIGGGSTNIKGSVTFYKGEKLPDNDVGKVGDVYFKTDTGNMYIKKSSNDSEYGEWLIDKAQNEDWLPDPENENSFIPYSDRSVYRKSDVSYNQKPNTNVLRYEKTPTIGNDNDIPNVKWIRENAILKQMKNSVIGDGNKDEIIDNYLDKNDRIIASQNVQINDPNNSSIMTLSTISENGTTSELKIVAENNGDACLLGTTPSDNAYKNEIVTAEWIKKNVSGKKLGEYIWSSIPLLDSEDQFGLKLLNGQRLDRSVYEDFGNRIEELYGHTPNIERVNDNRSEDKIAERTDNEKGYFYFNSSFVWLPDISDSIGSFSPTTDELKLSEYTKGMLPNITGDTGSDSTRGTSGYDPTGAFYTKGKSSWAAANAIISTALAFDASRCSSVYGDSETVQPESIKVFVYIVVLTNITGDYASFDFDEFIEEVNDLKSTVASVTSSQGLGLFSCQWLDHKIPDSLWVLSENEWRSDNWLEKNKYQNAYDHLINDIKNIPSESETIGNTTITFYRASDGHKICLADQERNQERNIEDIFQETGIAWYYLLDKTNERFRLPRTKYDFNGYRDNAGDYIPESLPQHTHFISSANGNGTEGLNNSSSMAFNSITGHGHYDYTLCRDSATATVGLSSNASSSVYQDNAPVQPPATQMYLYFFLEDTSEDYQLLNSPFFFGMYQWFQGTINNLSWLESDENFHDGNVYVDFYNWLLKVKNHEETIDGFEVKSNNEAYNDYDFVINEQDKKFRLPKKVHGKLGDAVVGNGMTLGLTDGTYNVGTGPSGGNTERLWVCGPVYGEPVGSIMGSTGSQTDRSLGVTTDATKSGVEVDTSNMKLYFYVGNVIKTRMLIDLTNLEKDIEKNNKNSVGYPDWDSEIELAIGTDNIIDSYGWVMFQNKGDNYHGGCIGKINDKQVYFRFGENGSFRDYNSLLIPVIPNDKVSLTNVHSHPASKLSFYPLKEIE